MYLKSRVKIPDVHGKLIRLRRGDITYIKYEYDRYYNPEKKYTYPQRATIGNEYSCAVTPQVRQTGNRLSGLAGTAYASLLA